MSPITRQQIENLQIGDYVQQTRDVEAFTGKLKDNARWSEPAEVVEITYRGVSVADRAYVGIYTRTGTETGRMGFSIVEGENFCRLAV